MVVETFDMAWLDLLFFLSCFHLVVPPHDPSQRRELDRTNPSNSSKTKATTNNAFTPLRSCMLLLVCFGLGVVKKKSYKTIAVLPVLLQPRHKCPQCSSSSPACAPPQNSENFRKLFALCVCVCVMCFVCVRVCKGAPAHGTRFRPGVI
jgi:hypothetical protein